MTNRKPRETTNRKPRGMMRCIPNELEKLWRRRRNRVLLFCAVAVCFIWAVTEDMLGSGLLPITFHLTFSPLTVLSFVSGCYLPAAAFFGAADLYAAEHNSGYIRWMNAARLRSRTVFLSKFAALFLFCALCLFLLFIFSLFFSALYSPNAIDGQKIVDSLVAYAVTLLPICCVTALAALIANLFQNGFTAAVTACAVYLLLGAAGAFFPVISAVSFLTYTHWYVLWIGQIAPFSKLVNIFLILSSSSVVLLSTGYLFFIKQEDAAYVR